MADDGLCAWAMEHPDKLALAMPMAGPPDQNFISENEIRSAVKAKFEANAKVIYRRCEKKRPYDNFKHERSQLTDLLEQAAYIYVILTTKYRDIADRCCRKLVDLGWPAFEIRNLRSYADWCKGGLREHYGNTLREQEAEQTAREAFLLFTLVSDDPLLRGLI